MESIAQDDKDNANAANVLKANLLKRYFVSKDIG